MCVFCICLCTWDMYVDKKNFFFWGRWCPWSWLPYMANGHIYKRSERKYKWFVATVNKRLVIGLDNREWYKKLNIFFFGQLIAIYIRNVLFCDTSKSVFKLCLINRMCECLFYFFFVEHWWRKRLVIVLMCEKLINYVRI